MANTGFYNALLYSQTGMDSQPHRLVLKNQYTNDLALASNDGFAVFMVVVVRDLALQPAFDLVVKIEVQVVMMPVSVSVSMAE